MTPVPSGSETGPPGIGPPALPGAATDGERGATSGNSSSGDAAAGVGSQAGPGGAGIDAALLDEVPEDIGPSGLVRVPVPDPRLRALWAAGGSPREGQGLAARFTEGRPGPWGFSLFYLALIGLFGFVVFRLWGVLGGLEGRDLEEQGVDTPFPEAQASEALGQAEPPERDT